MDRINASIADDTWQKLKEQFKNLRENQKERPRFTDEQVGAVIDAVKPECRPLFIFIR